MPSSFLAAAMATTGAFRARRTEDARERAYTSLAAFVRSCWLDLEPSTPLQWTWHLDVLCDALQRQAEGDLAYRRLVICVPPGTMKSLLTAVFLPAWVWLRNPYRRRLCVAGADKVATRDSRRTRQLLRGPRYAALKEHAHDHHGVPLWRTAHDQDVKVQFEFEAQAKNGTWQPAGGRWCQSLGADVAGQRADDVTIDDPVAVNDVVVGSPEQVIARLADVKDRIEKVLPTRVNNQKTARWTLIMQRLHPDDPAGRAIADGWTAVVLPMRFDPDLPAQDGGPWPGDSRMSGDLLDPERFPEEIVVRLEESLGSQASGQLAMRPTAKEGGLFQRMWFARRYKGTPEDIAEQADMVLGSVDATFKAAGGSWVVIQVWASKGADRFLLDQVRERMGVVDTEDVLRRLFGPDGRWSVWCRDVVVEDKANGPALVDRLRAVVSGIREVSPGTRSKWERAEVHSVPPYRAGQVVLPADGLTPWLSGFVERHVAFDGRGSAPDDEIDAESQALACLGGLGSGQYKRVVRQGAGGSSRRHSIAPW